MEATMSRREPLRRRPVPHDQDLFSLSKPPPILRSESQHEFAALRGALNQEIQPRGPIEQIYAAEMTNAVWEILRLCRCKTVVINTSFHKALEALLVRFCEPGEDYLAYMEEKKALISGWFTDERAKAKVLEILRTVDLDESAIEAEAICQSAACLETLNRLIASLESRRDKALRRIYEYREGSGSRLRDSANKIIDVASNKSSAA
jgi:hypothetical protein